MIQVVDQNGEKVIQVDGLIQSSSDPNNGYWHYMVPDREIKKVLLLGVGGGTIPKLILEKNPKAKILGIDNDPEIIRQGIEHFGLGDLDMDIIIGDAFTEVHQLTDKFDLIIVDIYSGYNFPLKFIMPKFLNKIHELLADSGDLYINTPNIDQALTLQLPTRKSLDLGGSKIYMYSKNDGIIVKGAETEVKPT